MSIFNRIKRLLVNLENERDFGISKIMPDRIFSVNQKDWKVIRWLKENKVLVISKMRKEGDNYVVYYKEIDVENPFFAYTGLRSRQTEDNSDFRYYSSGEVTERHYKDDNSKYERLSIEDDVLKDFYITYIGKWNSPQEFVETMQEKALAELEKYRDLWFKHGMSAPEYVQSEGVEEEPAY